MLVLPGVAILLAGLWREAIVYWRLLAAGSVLGCALTGHPIRIFNSVVRHMFWRVRKLCVVTRQLEPELHPSDGSVPAVLAVAVLLLWRKISSGWNSSRCL